MKKLWIAFLSLMTFVPASAFAVHISTGQVVKMHHGLDRFAIYINATSACATQWNYSYESDYADYEEFKRAYALALVAYAQKKTVSVFYPTNTCGRFNSMDTGN